METEKYLTMGYKYLQKGQFGFKNEGARLRIAMRHAFTSYISLRIVAP